MEQAILEVLCELYNVQSRETMHEYIVALRDMCFWAYRMDGILTAEEYTMMQEYLDFDVVHIA